MNRYVEFISFFPTFGIKTQEPDHEEMADSSPSEASEIDDLTSFRVLQ